MTNGAKPRIGTSTGSAGLAGAVMTIIAYFFGPELTQDPTVYVAVTSIVTILAQKLAKYRKKKRRFGRRGI